MARHFNFNHFYYFWQVAKEGNLTRAAARLLIAQSALSSQIKQLEHQIGTPLFRKEGRQLALTEAGNIAFAYAEKMFVLSQEMHSVLRHKTLADKTVLKIGVIASLSRNFVENFIRPLLTRHDVEIVLDSGSAQELQEKLINHKLDLILSNFLPDRQQQFLFRMKPIAEQQLSIVGKPLPPGKVFDLKNDLPQQQLLLPGTGTEIRARFDQICEQLHISYQIMAEINDMPALRLLARDSDGIALLPSVVVQDELRNGTLQEYCKVPDLYEHFYAISLKKQYEPEIMRYLLARNQELTVGPVA